jgi:DNA invertase Pin-like site-specific DNA recombinase
MINRPSELAELLTRLNDASSVISQPANLRYVVYARRSTDEPERQVRSLSDQIAECKDLVESKSLNVVAKPIQEAESAKEPDIRPKFRQMIEDVKQGKYDGIIAWHPDRLSRNMKDAGELIDLLDKGVIKDLKFCSFTFENTTAGKMLLGIAFVLSKQYSDKLSDDVKRGMRRSIEEGRWLNKPKHGYFKDRNQFLRPDGHNFVIIKIAWKMRMEKNNS